MFLKTENQQSQYVRHSKTGLEHRYTRNKVVATFRCDECDQVFQRDLKHVDRKRLSNNYFHCCAGCNPKKFAQRKGVEKKKILDLPASSTLPVGKY